ncbi:MAG: hypothetical protein RIS54_291 [Verrucomicrobiota bacterium]|jgi:hypothetical protein
MKTVLLIAVAALVGIQFFRPAKNLSSTPPGRDDVMALHPPSPEVCDVLTRACYDCHSNHTRYPLYAEVQPVAWWLDHHIREGKAHLNFSKFGTYDLRRQRHKLEELVGELEDDEMPLKSYRLTHADARLTPAEVTALIAWAEEAQDALADR